MTALIKAPPSVLSNNYQIRLIDCLLALLLMIMRPFQRNDFYLRFIYGEKMSRKQFIGIPTIVNLLLNKQPLLPPPTMGTIYTLLNVTYYESDSLIY